MASFTLRSAIFLAAALCIYGENQKVPLSRSEEKWRRSEKTSPDLWKLKGKAKEILGANAGDLEKRGKEKEMLREKARAKLQEVFGVSGDEGVAPKDTPRRRKEKQVPPLFMMELYREVADPYTGVVRGENPFGADVVRSYVERGSSHSDFLIFDVSGLASTEQVVEAELHLYRMRSFARLHNSSRDKFFFPPYYLIRVYQALSNDTSLPIDSHRLLSVQHVSDISTPGWHVLKVREAVLDWIKGTRPNMGLIVTITSPSEGEERRLTRTEVRIARRNEHHNSRQPILVLFNTEGKTDYDEKQRHPSRGYPSYYERIHEGEEGGDPLMESDGRRKRESLHQKTRSRDSNFSIATPAPPGICQRVHLYINFTDMELDDVIIAPSGFDSYQCQGHCDFPLVPAQNPTNHAILQNMVNLVGFTEGVKKPCCVPSRLLPLSILAFESGNVVIRKYKDMVVESCGCH